MYGLWARVVMLDGTAVTVGGGAPLVLSRHVFLWCRLPILLVWCSPWHGERALPHKQGERSGSGSTCGSRAVVRATRMPCQLKAICVVPVPGARLDGVVGKVGVIGLHRVVALGRSRRAGFCSGEPQLRILRGGRAACASGAVVHAGVAGYRRRTLLLQKHARKQAYEALIRSDHPTDIGCRKAADQLSRHT